MTGKRIFALLMAGILLLSLVSCGNTKQPAQTGDPAVPQNSTPTETQQGDITTPATTPSDNTQTGETQPAAPDAPPANDPITAPGTGGEEDGTTDPSQTGGETAAPTDPSVPDENTPSTDEPGGQTVEDILAAKNGDGYQIVVDGTTYTRRSDVSAYLVIGVDKAGTVNSGDLIGGQCDVLMVLAVDSGAKKFTMLQLHRDSMVDVDIIDYTGGQTGVSKKQQICFAHTYGNGDAKSCENTVRAVSRLLYGLKIDGYVSLNYGAVTPMNDAVGGVTVKIEDDMTNVDPAFVKGESVLLTGDQALKFVRARMSVGDGTNTSRMRRQRTYLSALAAKLRQEIKGNSSIINDVYNSATPYMVSDMSASSITNMGTKCLSYADGGIVTPKGESKTVRYANGNNYVEHYVDEADLQRILINLFYTK